MGKLANLCGLLYCSVVVVVIVVIVVVNVASMNLEDSIHNE